MTKTTPPIFREEVTPLLYSALEAEQVMVQERALQTVPRLCEILEFSHVKEVLFPNIAKVRVARSVIAARSLICGRSTAVQQDQGALLQDQHAHVLPLDDRRARQVHAHGEAGANPCARQDARAVGDGECAERVIVGA